MSPREERLLLFVALRLDSMLRRPALWGSAVAVEEQVLQLIEMRRLLLDPTTRPSNDTRELMDGYLNFLANELGEAPSESLAEQLDREGRTSELGPILLRFADADLAAILVAIDGDLGREAEDPETGDRALAILARVKRWFAAVANVERSRPHRGEHIPVVFPAQEPR